MPEQYIEFKGLLKAGIGERTNTEFAKIAKVSPEWISRTLNKEEIPRPSRNTLEKIAPHMSGGITLDMLLESCGYEVSQSGSANWERTNLTTEERKKENADDINEGLKTMIGYRQFWSDIEEFFSHFVMLFAVENLNCAEVKEIDFSSRYIQGAERAMLVNFSWENSSYIVSTFAVLYYLRTDKGKLFFFGHSLDDIAIMEAGFALPYRCETLISNNNVRFVSISKEKKQVSNQVSLSNTTKKELKYKKEINVLRSLIEQKNAQHEEETAGLLCSAAAALCLLEQYQELGTLEELVSKLEQ